MERLVKTSLVESEWAEVAQEHSADLLSAQSTGLGGAPGLKEVAHLKAPKVWAVGGGKGGVGKSLIAANFAIMLARSGRKVLAVDLDLGGSNLHTCLGFEPTQSSIGDYFSGRTQDLASLTNPTSEPKLFLISGSNDPVNVLRRAKDKGQELLKGLRALSYDDIVIDLGAGTQDMTIDFFLEADEGILSILPEPTSVENAYRFIRAVFLSLLKASDVAPGIKEVIEASMDQKNFLGIRTPADLLAVVQRLDPLALEVLKKRIAGFAPSIVINQVRSQADIDVGKSICSVCRRYFGLQLRYVGYLEYDNTVWKSVRSKRAVIQEYPNSILTSRFDKMTRTLLGEAKGLFP